MKNCHSDFKFITQKIVFHTNNVIFLETSGTHGGNFWFSAPFSVVEIYGRFRCVSLPPPSSGPSRQQYYHLKWHRPFPITVCSKQ